MTDRLKLTQNSLDELLSWLDSNREEAGRKYKVIHDGLVMVLRRKGCSEAEELADEVINRVAMKVGDLKISYEGKPERFFYGVAKKIVQEYERKARKSVPLNEELQEIPGPEPADELVYDCVDACKRKLDPNQCETVIQYHRHDKPEQREKLAKHLGITLATLRVRIFRIHALLRLCVDDCLERGGVEIKSIEKHSM